MENKIFVSFVAPTYNVNKYLDDFFTSFRMIKSNNYEIVIIDDKGDERPDHIIEQYEDLNIKVVKNKKNIGLARTRNVGLKNISKKSTHVVYIDTDDAITSGDFMNEIIMNKITFFNENIWTTKGLFYNDLNKNFGKNIYHGSMCGKALPVDIAKKYPFDETIRFYEDLLINRRIIKDYKDEIILSKTSLLDYRQRGTSISNDDFSLEKFRDFANQYQKCINEGLLSKRFALYELRQRYWIWRKNLKGKVVDLGNASFFIRLFGFLGGNAVKYLGIKNFIYKKSSKDLFI